MISITYDIQANFKVFSQSFQIKSNTYLHYINKIILLSELKDTTVEPRETSHFEFYAPGQDKEIVPLRESPIYLEDWIGLR